MDTQRPVPDDLIEGVIAGDFRSVARMITLVENDAPEAIPCLRRLFKHAGRAFAIGITGAAGCGKSTLADQLATRYRKDGKTIGIIAVDPTSPFSGGAILGDRIRMQSRDPDPGIFMRSMATRGHLGGLTRTAADVLTILDAAGFDIVLIETVGVGQDEVEIVRSADVTLVLLVPGMGDDIQALKAGVMEIGDIFVINKADHAGVERAESVLRSLISMNNRHGRWSPAIVRTIATTGLGIEDCTEAIDAFRRFRHQTNCHKGKNIQVQKERLLELAQGCIMRRLTEDPQISEKLDDLALQIADGKTDPFSATEELLGNSDFWRLGRKE
jgi:LAO/AO transport system kinase